MTAGQPPESQPQDGPELAYLDMRALRRRNRPNRWRRTCLALAPYARLLVYLYAGLIVASAVLSQGLQSSLWIAAVVIGIATGIAALMGIAGRQWVRGETVGGSNGGHGTAIPFVVRVEVEDRDER